ncbi:PH domain-containing protein [Priestia sp. YIM B13490]|uniref:PH domain-containing protein n=1 Tax=Priestia sp. YIM B13490 TaxID=3366310 RepID=UPI003672550A
MLKIKGNKVSPYSIKIWKYHVWIMYLILYIIGLLVLSLSLYREWGNLVFWLTTLLIIVLLVVNLLEIKFIVPLRFKNFSYVIQGEYISIRQGGIFKKNTIIPVNKIYYVNRKSGPLLEKYSLENIVVGTLAGEHVIPCLTEEKSNELQQKIIDICEIVEYEEEKN